MRQLDAHVITIPKSFKKRPNYNCQFRAQVFNFLTLGKIFLSKLQPSGSKSLSISRGCSPFGPWWIRHLVPHLILEPGQNLSVFCEQFQLVLGPNRQERRCNRQGCIPQFHFELWFVNDLSTTRLHFNALVLGTTFLSFQKVFLGNAVGMTGGF